MASLSDSLVKDLNVLLQWVTIFGTFVGLVAAVGLFFVRSELGRRQEARLAEVTTRLADAKHEIAGLEGTVKDVEQQAGEANRKAELERSERVSLEATLSPRIICWTPEVREELGWFSGTNVKIEIAVDDKETLDFAKQLASGLRNAQWSVPPLEAGSHPTRGLRIYTKHIPDESLRGKLADAARILAFHLKANNILTSCFALPPESDGFAARVPDNGILVEIGVRAEDHFMLQAMRRAIPETDFAAFQSCVETGRQVMSQNSDYDTTERAHIVAKYKRAPNAAPRDGVAH